MSDLARVIWHISEQAPWGNQESPVEHVAQTAAVAIDDLNAAIWTAGTRRELTVLRELAEALIKRLEASAATALTLDEWFDHMRGK